jgi:serine/threonine protein kinase/formylglycine-generating enzyme required for sulfatase activity/outer membrane murein-binding lipoprotein Lpp
VRVSQDSPVRAASRKLSGPREVGSTLKAGLPFDSATPDEGGWSPPREFDEYVLVRLLGQGSSGRVYLARDTVLDRAVAVKFIGHVAPDAEDRERFLVEARAVARLQHPNVVTIHRVGELAGHPYLITEYIRGKSLSEIAVPVGWRKVLEFGVGLARGLAAAHRQNVLHRDIKLANAILSEAGEIKLLDFSLAKLLDPTAAEPVQPLPSRAAAVDAATAAVHRHVAEQGRRPPESATPRPVSVDRVELSAAALAAGMSLKAGHLTQVGTLLGTPNYMAPELWRAEAATRRSDVYALGVLMYILASGWPPTEADTAIELATRVQELDPRPLLERAPRCDPRLAAIIDRCLRRDALARYASADDLLAALEALQPMGREVEIPEGNPYRGLQAFESKHRAVFFGRAAEIRAVLERLRADALVVVAGDSGVGKSSLVKAGVVPLVEEGNLDGSRQWASATITPGRYPLPTLLAALAGLFDMSEETLSEQVKEGPDALVRALRKQLGDARGRLLVIDQFEELATIGGAEEVAIVGPLLARLASGLPGLRVIATVRGDFLTRVAQVPGIGDELSRAIYILRPLSPEGAREAIVGPARVKGVSFESETLVDALVKAGSQGSLPLLQFALAELWEIRDQAAAYISAADLTKIGGVTGALARHGDAALAQLIPEQRIAARRVLMRLVTVDDTRAVRTEEELVAGSAAAEAALKALVRSRLVVAREVGDQAVFEIAHEALISGWATLGAWLEEEREVRAVRHRLELAVTEWERLGRSRDALWSGKPLQEVLALEPATLRPKEREFVAACKAAAARLQRLRRVAAVAVPVVAALIYGAVWLQGHRALMAKIDEHVAAAQEDGAAADRLLAESNALRAEAFAAFDAGQAARGEELWARYVAALPGIERTMASAAQRLETALSLDGRRDDVRERLLDALYKRALMAEKAGRDELAIQDLLDRLRLHDGTGEHLARWDAPAKLEVTSDPPGATVTLDRYVAEDGRRRIGSSRRIGESPISSQTLERGSYRLRFELQGRAPVTFPVLLERGESLAVSVLLPPAETVPEGYVYVPAGRFLYGSRDPEPMRKWMRAEPRHTVETGPYLIALREVTYADYIEYLTALSEQERGPLLRATAESPTHLEQLPGGRWRLVLNQTLVTYTAESGEPLVYEGRRERASVVWERLPVSHISGAEAAAYIAWLDRSGRLRGARFCEEHEWERAARGADGRLFAGGDALRTSDANFDETHGKVSAAYGPDPVGSYPHTTSPFGLYDTDGNVHELTVSPLNRDGLMVRGGAFFYSATQGRTTARFDVPVDLRDPAIGLRVCATWPAPVPSK